MPTSCWLRPDLLCQVLPLAPQITRIYVPANTMALTLLPTSISASVRDAREQSYYCVIEGQEKKATHGECEHTEEGKIQPI